MKRVMTVLAAILVAWMLFAGVADAQAVNPPKSPPDPTYLTTWYLFSNGAYLPNLGGGLSYLPRVANMPESDTSCPAWEDGVIELDVLAAHHLRRTGWGCVGTALPYPLGGAIAGAHPDTYWGMAIDWSNGTVRLGGASYVAPFWSLVDGITVKLSGNNDNPIIVYPRLYGPLGEITDGYRFLAEGGHGTGIALFHTAHASYRLGDGSVRWGCDHFGDGYVAELDGVFAPDNTTPFLLVHAGGGVAGNREPPNQISAIAVYPDCGDAFSLFPPSCVAIHGHPPIAGDVFTSGGFLGGQVSNDVVLRPLVLGVRVNGQDVYPTQVAPWASSLPDPSPNRWPLPAEMTERQDIWMSVWHASKWVWPEGNPPPLYGASEILHYILQGNQRIELPSFQDQVNNHPLVLRGFAGGTVLPDNQFALISVDLRGVGQRPVDTGDDGLAVWTGSAWASPETISYTAGLTYTFRVLVHVPSTSATGSVDAYAAWGQPPTYERIASFVVPPGGAREVTFQFQYRIPVQAALRGRLDLRVIYRVGRGSPSSSYPTVSGGEPFRSTRSCTGGYACSVGEPTVSPIAEPLNLGGYGDKLVTTGEVEDYTLSVRPSLTFRGRTYRVADDSAIAGVVITLTTPSGVMTTTTTQAGYTFEVTAPVSGTYTLYASPVAGGLYLWETGPGELLTSDRPPYVKEVAYGQISYTFSDTPWGEFRRNDFGYGEHVVSGRLLNLISGSPVPGGVVTLTVAVKDADYCNWQSGAVFTATTGADGVFTFPIPDPGGLIYLFPKCLRLEFPPTIQVSGGVVTYTNHLPGNPPGVKDGRFTVLELEGSRGVYWMGNDGYYVALRAEIIRQYPVVPVNPDSLTYLLSPRRQAVTTTVDYRDSDGSWRPLEVGVQTVNLTLTIQTAAPERFFYPPCADNQPTCQVVLCPVAQSGCAPPRQLGGRYTFFAQEQVGITASGAYPKIPYRLFAITPGRYTATAVWHLAWQGADGEWYNATLTTEPVTWEVVGVAFRREE